MYRFYLTIDPDRQLFVRRTRPKVGSSNANPLSPPASSTHQLPLESSPKVQTSIVPTPPSPHTMRRNISKENFIKYQWAWTL